MIIRRGVGLQDRAAHQDFRSTSRRTRWGVAAIVGTVLAAALSVTSYILHRELGNPLFNIDLLSIFKKEPTRDEQIAQQAHDSYVLGIAHLGGRSYIFPVPERLKGQNDHNAPAYFSYNMATMQLCEVWRGKSICRNGLEIDPEVRHKVEDSACAMARERDYYLFTRQYCRPRIVV